MESTMKYMLKVHILDSIVVPIFSIDSAEVRKIWLKTNLTQHVNKMEGLVDKACVDGQNWQAQRPTSLTGRADQSDRSVQL